MSLNVALVLLAGGLAGAGAWVVVRQLISGVPALGPALRGLGPPTTQPEPAGPPIPGLVGAIAARLRIPQQELMLIGYSVERYVTEKIAMTLLGLAAPVVISFILTFTPLHLGLVIPAGLGLGLATLFFWLEDVSIHQRASAAREVFARRVAVYVKLVAQQLAKSKGPTEALTTAAAVGGGWTAERVRACLEESRLRLEPPWESLRALGAEIGVPELGEIGDIMTVAGAEGAHVYHTLRSRASSMHTAWIAAEEERANRATTVLYIPTSLLVFVLFILGAYPLLIRLITT